MADVFMQFTQERGTAIDLMLVRDETFEQFWTASEERTAMGVLVRVPSLDHLIALNLHALKQQLAHRTFKDADDVGSLVRMNKLDLQSPRYEQLFLKNTCNGMVTAFTAPLHESVRKSSQWAAGPMRGGSSSMRKTTNRSWPAGSCWRYGRRPRPR